MFTFLTVVQAIVAAALVGAILMQRSEGGGLTGGGNPSGMVSARGAGDLMTRTTAILALLFVVLSIALAVLAVNEGGTASIDTSFERQQTADPLSADPLSPDAPALEIPSVGDPLAPEAGSEAPVLEGADAGEAGE
jgi:preprotein translocase subunit SecG